MEIDRNLLKIYILSYLSKIIYNIITLILFEFHPKFISLAQVVPGPIQPWQCIKVA